MAQAKAETQQNVDSLRGDIAIIGMSCLFPGAPGVDTFWHNIVSKVDAISDPPADAWDPAVYYDPKSDSNDRTYCKRGGYIGDIATFRSLDFGVMPVNVDGGEPDQWLALQTAHEAAANAGYEKSFPEHVRTEVILGKGTYVNRGNMTVGYHGLIVDQVVKVLQNLHPEYTSSQLQAIKEELKGSLPPFSADTAPALIGNIIAGRVANRMDLMGPSFTVDGACASALLAVEIGIRDLLTGKCDVVLAGGSNVTVPLPTLILFCQLGALSRREQIRPFDKDADGTLLAEGLGVVVLKRLEDAERDNDRIYAVIKGVGTSSDGRALHVMAPRIEGEELALRRAYEAAGVSPQSVGLIEAHGTATPVGDAIEIQALTRVFGERGGAMPTCALGSVKSMIGHTMPAAGIAGIIKTALALYHRVLPPTINCTEPDPQLELDRTPFYVNTETRPWIHGDKTPRRAGVNAFGFGGINGHVVLEEYVGNGEPQRSHLLTWDTEVIVFEGASRAELLEKGEHLRDHLARSIDTPLKDLAFTLNSQVEKAAYRLSIVAKSIEDLSDKLSHACGRLAEPKCRQIKDTRGIYFFEEPLSPEGKLAVMFPGEGAQYRNMMADLCLHFPEVRNCFDIGDHAFVGHPRGYLPSDFIFPRAIVSERERSQMDQRLWQIDGAVEAVLIASTAMWTLLKQLELNPDVIVGHSTGDYSAMFASGVIALPNQASYIKTGIAWNKTHETMAKKLAVPEVALLAVAADLATVESIVESVGGDLFIAMENCPHQNVIVGDKGAIEQVSQRLQAQGLIYESLPFDRPYHTPLFEPYAKAWGDEFFSKLPICAPTIDLYSCTSVSRYPTDPEEIKDLFVDHWGKPVLFTDTINAMYADGVRIFIEAGPRGNLTAFVGDILRGLPHLAMPSNVASRSGISQLNHLVGVLAAQGIDLNLDCLYARRDPQLLPWTTPPPDENRTRPAVKLPLGVPDLKVAPRHGQHAASTTINPASSGAEPEKSQQTESPRPPNPETTEAQAMQYLRHHGAASDARVMHEHLQSMDKFLDAQQQVMRAFFDRVGDATRGVEERRGPQPHSFPMLGTTTSSIPGKRLITERVLSRENDTFLNHHALGGQVSHTDPGLTAIVVVPLTMSMEILAEAAAALTEGQVVIGMRNVEASRWIRVDDEPVTLQIHAERREQNPQEVEVRVLVIPPRPEHQRAPQIPAIRAVAVVGDRYPDPPSMPDFRLEDEKISRLASSDLYDGQLMFHGPNFQGVSKVMRSGNNGMLGELQVLPANDLFRAIPHPGFVTDPVLLDAAGQLVGFWTKEYLPDGFVVFPYRLQALRIYGPNRTTGERCECRLRIELLGKDRTRSDLNILAPDGTVWMQLTGWEDRRFDPPARFHQFWVSPHGIHVSEPWTAPLDLLGDKDDFACYRLDRLFESGEDFWTELWSSLVLTREERKGFLEKKGAAARQQEWLSGRTVAKDATRALLKRRSQLDLLPADIAISPDEHGRPILDGSWTRQLSAIPQISLAHCRGSAVAVAGFIPAECSLGVDLEIFRELPDSFEVTAFFPDEREVFANAPTPARAEWILRLWCAKEAVGKALGRGLPDGPLSVQIVSTEPDTGIVGAGIRGRLAEEFPGLANAELIVYTTRDQDYVIALTLCERKSP